MDEGARERLEGVDKVAAVDRRGCCDVSAALRCIALQAAFLLLLVYKVLPFIILLKKKLYKLCETEKEGKSVSSSALAVIVLSPPPSLPLLLTLSGSDPLSHSPPLLAKLPRS